MARPSLVPPTASGVLEVESIRLSPSFARSPLGRSPMRARRYTPFCLGSSPPCLSLRRDAFHNVALAIGLSVHIHRRRARAVSSDLLRSRLGSCPRIRRLLCLGVSGGPCN